jgi:hypothetical protein
MPLNTSFYTKSLPQTLAVIRLMASPEGATVNELAQHLSLNRRSVFRLLHAIEHKFHIPVTMKRKTFGCPFTYHLPQSFIDRLSAVKIPSVTLTFEEAMLAYLLTIPGKLPVNDDTANLSMLRDRIMNAVKQP